MRLCGNTPEDIAHAASDRALARVFAAKGRPADHPLIVHLAAADEIERWARDIPATVWALAAGFWPGPLTLILKRTPGVPDAVTGGQATVGLRVPDHPVALQLLEAFGGGIAAPSVQIWVALTTLPLLAARPETNKSKHGDNNLPATFPASNVKTQRSINLYANLMGEVMLNWRTILCGVDGSEESIRATKLGAMIAKRLSARLLGLYVIPSHQVFQLGIHRAQGEAELAADAQLLLNRLQEETGFSIEPLILEGDPAATILEVATEQSCDLIVVGHRGLGKVERWLMGNVASKVVLHTPCTVLVSKDMGPVLDSPFARTLCGLDGSRESERAGIEALGLVSLLGGTVCFAHVTYRVQGAEIEPLVGDYESAGTLLAKFSEEARKAGVAADSVELAGQPPLLFLITRRHGEQASLPWGRAV